MSRDSDVIVHCPNCKQEISVSADTCRYCGFSLGNYRAMLLKREEEKRNCSNEYSDREDKTPSVGNIIKRLIATIVAIFIGVGAYSFLTNSIKGSEKETKETSRKVFLNNEQTSKPTPTVNPAVNNVFVSSVRMSENSIGIPILYVVFQNDGNETVDRIDFVVQCYNAYGELLRPSLLSDGKQCFFDTNLKPGKKSDKNQYLSLSSFSGVRSVEIAVIKYHTANGDTVEIPYDQRNYQKYSFK